VLVSMFVNNPPASPGGTNTAAGQCTGRWAVRGTVGAGADNSAGNDASSDASVASILKFLKFLKVLMVLMTKLRLETGARPEPGARWIVCEGGGGCALLLRAGQSGSQHSS
jgi:hypothetical protein